MQFIADIRLIVDKDVRIEKRPQIDEGEKKKGGAGMEAPYVFIMLVSIHRFGL